MPVKSHKVSRNAGKRPPDRLGDFRAWLADRFSEPEHIYHRGVLAADRAKDEELNRLAEAVFACSGALPPQLTTYGNSPVTLPQTVEIGQRRLGLDRFEYFARKIRAGR
jgi:hypothetical protein